MQGTHGTILVLNARAVEQGVQLELLTFDAFL
jgi:hypothetical protein